MKGDRNVSNTNSSYRVIYLPFPILDALQDAAAEYQQQPVFYENTWKMVRLPPRAYDKN